MCRTSDSAITKIINSGYIIRFTERCNILVGLIERSLHITYAMTKACNIHVWLHFRWWQISQYRMWHVALLVFASLSTKDTLEIILFCCSILINFIHVLTINSHIASHSFTHSRGHITQSLQLNNHKQIIEKLPWRCEWND